MSVCQVSPSESLVLTEPDLHTDSSIAPAHSEIPQATSFSVKFSLLLGKVILNLINLVPHLSSHLILSNFHIFLPFSHCSLHLLLVFSLNRLFLYQTFLLQLLCLIFSSLLHPIQVLLHLLRLSFLLSLQLLYLLRAFLLKQLDMCIEILCLRPW